jgi:hypothetical protein
MELIKTTSSLEETIGLEKTSPFIEANTIECSIEELEQKHIIPVFSKDNEAVISHLDFIKTTHLAACNIFGESYVNEPIIRVSHPIKGRIPEARNKPVNKLTEDEKTIYYERMAFIIEIPGIKEMVDGNLLSLTVGGVKAYNLDNLNTRYSPQQFKYFIGFKNKVCTNLCISTDGTIKDQQVLELDHLYKSISEHFLDYDLMTELELYKSFGHFFLSENELAQVLGKARLYNHLPNSYKKDIPPILLNDTQWNSIARGVYSDENFKSTTTEGIDGWRLYNLLTGANKTSYIDSFVDRGENCTSFIKLLADAKFRNRNVWYLN